MIQYNQKDTICVNTDSKGKGEVTPLQARLWPRGG